MNGKRFSEEKTRRNGFYLALAVCLVAVGIAAWSTYDAVNSYTEPQSSLSQQEGSSSTSSQVQAGISLEEEDGEGQGSSSSRSETSSKPSDDPEAPVPYTRSTSSLLASAPASLYQSSLIRQAGRGNPRHCHEGD